jgi:hypothetical protein
MPEELSTLQTVPDCSRAEVQVSPSMPTQFAAAWGYVVTPDRCVQVGCWKVPWMSLIDLPVGALFTEPHQLALLAVGLVLRVFR